jgi:hypothetical protein
MGGISGIEIGYIKNECPHCHRKEKSFGTMTVPRMKD